MPNTHLVVSSKFESDRRKSKSKSLFQPKGNINNYNIFKGKKKKQIS